ncbi:MAG: NADP-dependent oxidoreductase [Pseudomonadales bacterium]|nr:NADP-dependent oxidoreductase [Pseudomonadales bacterium]
MTSRDNERVVLARDLVGTPEPDDFRYELCERPVVGPGQMLVEAEWLSLDPYVRALLSGRHFLRQPRAGDVLPARSVARVVDSRHAVFSIGDRVVLETGLQRRTVSNGDDAWLLHPGHSPASTALGILGMPGMTAYFGMLDVAQLKAGDTVLVSAASGPVGSMVGQIARIKGARAIGIAGGPHKCTWTVREARFDACIDYKNESVDQRLRELAPRGVDIYFDNTGGEILNTVVMGRHLAMHGRVILCGLITQYNLKDAPNGPNLGPLMACRGKILPMVVYDYENRREEFLRAAIPWFESGQLAYREDVAEGLDNAAAQFCKLMRGENFGKTLVRLL